MMRPTLLVMFTGRPAVSLIARRLSASIQIPRSKNSPSNIVVLANFPYRPRVRIGDGGHEDVTGVEFSERSTRNTSGRQCREN